MRKVFQQFLLLVSVLLLLDPRWAYSFLQTPGMQGFRPQRSLLHLSPRYSCSSSSFIRPGHRSSFLGTANPSFLPRVRTTAAAPTVRSFCSSGRSSWDLTGHPFHKLKEEVESATQTNSNMTQEGTEYEKWVRRLYTTNLFHPVKMGLQNIQALYNLLGNPLDDVIVIHIAGTNGKGSVALKMARSLELANDGLKVGLFCSPHVSSFRERMQVNQQLISESEVVEFLPPLYQLCVEHDIPATFFELTTALAFQFFRSQNVQVVVLETGLGGRLDATNVISSPAISIITSIGLEHTRILGDTIELIALEKGGIIKEGRPVLVGPNCPHDVLRECASSKGASAFYTCDDVLPLEDRSEEEKLDYDLENARIARAALELLQKSHGHVIGTISKQAMQQGTSQRPPCRFEEVTLDDSGLQVILDVAHNPPAMDYMVRKLRRTYPDDTFRIVVGMSADKDLRLCAESLLQAVDQDTGKIHLVEAAHPRAAKLEAMLQGNSRLQGAHYDLEDRSVTKQIEKASVLAVEGKERLVVCGSVFLMAEAREALGFDEPRDSAHIAEVAGAGVRHAQENFGNTTTTTTAAT